MAGHARPFAFWRRRDYFAAPICFTRLPHSAVSSRSILANSAGVLDTAALVEMRRQVRSGADPQAVAGGWLAEHPLGR